MTMNSMIDAYVTKRGEKKDSFSTGAVRDTQDGKLRFDLIGVHMMKRLSALLVRGASNYGERNWEKGQNVARTFASLFRHVVGYQEGDQTEDHLAAIVFNAMSIIHVEEEVRAGRLAAELLDLPFYLENPDWQVLARITTWEEQVVLEEMKTYSDGYYVQWIPWEQLKTEVFPSLNEQGFARIMHSLHLKGHVCPQVRDGYVHPHYALQSEVETLQPEEDYRDSEEYGDPRGD